MCVAHISEFGKWLCPPAVASVLAGTAVSVLPGRTHRERWYPRGRLGRRSAAESEPINNNWREMTNGAVPGGPGGAYPWEQGHSRGPGQLRGSSAGGGASRGSAGGGEGPEPGGDSAGTARGKHGPARLDIAPLRGRGPRDIGPWAGGVALRRSQWARPAPPAALRGSGARPRPGPQSPERAGTAQSAQRPGDLRDPRDRRVPADRSAPNAAAMAQ